MNEEAAIKIYCKLQSLERDLENVYREYNNGQINDDQFNSMILSTQRDIKVHSYIHNLIIKDNTHEPQR